MTPLSRVAVWVLLGLTILQSGCAICYYDQKSGVEHLCGFGHMKMKVTPPDEGYQTIVTGREIWGWGLGLGRVDYYTVFGWDRSSDLSIINKDTSIRFEWPDNDLFKVRVGSEPPFLKRKGSNLKSEVNEE